MKKIILISFFILNFFFNSHAQTNEKIANEIYEIMQIESMGENLISSRKDIIETKLKSNTIKEVDKKINLCELSKLQAEQKPIEKFKSIALNHIAENSDLLLILEIAKNQLTKKFYLLKAKTSELIFQNSSSEKIIDALEEFQFFTLSNKHFIEYNKKLEMNTINLQFSRAMELPSFITQVSIVEMSLDLSEQCKEQK